MLEVIVLLSVGVVVVSALLLGCVNIFQRLFNFRVFHNKDVEAGHITSEDYNGSLPSHSIEDGSQKVSFDPLPKVNTSSHAYRPRIVQSSIDHSLTPPKDLNYDVPREKLYFIKEMGNGWFGQILLGEAVGLVSGQSQVSVVISTLKDEATDVDIRVFHEEVNPYRSLNHRNVLSFLGHSKTAMPHLSILEHAGNGDLKSYLLALRHEPTTIPFVKFAMDIASGLSCLHRHNFVHRDLSCRTCQVMADLTVKVGDYGLSEELYKDDYIVVAGDMIPLRWLPPECVLISADGAVYVSPATKEANIWTMGVTMWELCSVATVPYPHLTNPQVIRSYGDRKKTRLTQPSFPSENPQDVYDIMKSCWEDPRPTIVDVITSLNHIFTQRSQEKLTDFEERWSQIGSKDKHPLSESDHKVLILFDPSSEAAEMQSDISFITQDPGAREPTTPSFKTTVIDVETPRKVNSALPHITSTPIARAEISSSFASARSSLCETPESSTFITAVGESFSIQDLSNIDAENESTLTLINATPVKVIGADNAGFVLGEGEPCPTNVVLREEELCPPKVVLREEEPCPPTVVLREEELCPPKVVLREEEPCAVVIGDTALLGENEITSNSHTTGDRSNQQTRQPDDERSKTNDTNRTDVETLDNVDDPSIEPRTNHGCDLVDLRVEPFLQSTEALSIESGIVDGGEDTDDSDGGKTPSHEHRAEPDDVEVNQETSIAGSLQTLEGEGRDDDSLHNNDEDGQRDVVSIRADTEQSDASVTNTSTTSSASSDVSDDVFKPADVPYFPRSPSFLLENAPLPSIPEDSVAPDISCDARQIKQAEQQESFENFDTYEWDDEIGNQLIGQVQQRTDYSIASPGSLRDLNSDWTLELGDSSRNSAGEEFLEGPTTKSVQNRTKNQENGEGVLQPEHNHVVTEASTRI